ncbi:Vegetative incompatibility protein HET-E-1 [Cyphellophora attinorum]|uniref:Vegetative incompatibility protein HET-E-1 n=1 Tax=Cyphellophora attinorum TaxID=1664694 RepID=A0A0N1HL57_9EURO|nr:Vegetative incompatibility protein HET-E-1 [Phialophora attinorum]KPI35174.1 Vegetative incompatibility protein HET-E-1 [Phialophora attinorum]
MRLLSLDSEDGLILSEDLPEKELPAYSILSHTWSLRGIEDEVTFADINNRTYRDKAGYSKVLFCARQAKQNGLDYCWVDTCCIDRSNSTELNRAIQSMFRWYQNAAFCYIYLSDVSTAASDGQNNKYRNWENDFKRSRWFRRGWTLQELLAPRRVVFFSQEGRDLGHREDLVHLLVPITRITPAALQGRELSTFSSGARQQWVEGRETKEPEDIVYCMLGVLGFSLVPNYGEGEANARARLRDEINKTAVFRRGVSYVDVATLLIFAVVLFIVPHWLTGSDGVQSYQQERKLDSNLPIYAVLGVTGVGKSTFIATAGGKHIETGRPPSISHQLESHTDATNFYRFDSRITGPGCLVDTPGIDESNRTRTDTEIMLTIENSLRELNVKDKLLMGLIFLYDIRSPRATGSILTALDTTLHMMDRLLGVTSIAKITLVTTKWTVGATYQQRVEEEQRERMLRMSYWQGPLSCNSEMARYDNTKDSALNIIARLKSRETPIEPPVDGCFPKPGQLASPKSPQQSTFAKSTSWRLSTALKWLLDAAAAVVACLLVYTGLDHYGSEDKTMGGGIMITVGVCTFAALGLIFTHGIWPLTTMWIPMACLLIGSSIDDLMRLGIMGFRLIDGLVMATGVCLLTGWWIYG